MNPNQERLVDDEQGAGGIIENLFYFLSLVLASSTATHITSAD
jgi:hypothetical protein